MAQYDYFIAGRWRNYEQVQKVLDTVRAHGKSAYCFIENLYTDSKLTFEPSANIDSIMKQLEALPHDDKFIQKIFKRDMQAQHDSTSFILVLPAGISGHVEAGVSYGLGKTCFAVGVPEKTETLYQIFDTIFPTIEDLAVWLKSDINRI